MSMYKYCNFVVICGNLLSRNALISSAKCDNWITKLDNKTHYLYGFHKSTIINNGAFVRRELMSTIKQQLLSV